MRTRGGTGARVSGYPPNPVLISRSREEEEAGGARGATGAVVFSAALAMGMPPGNLKKDSTYDRYNTAMMATLEEESEWRTYKRLLQESRGKGGAAPPYPEATVRRVQARVDELATAAALAALQAMELTETGAPPVDGDARASGKRPAAQAAAPPAASNTYGEVDPDYLISAFSETVAEVFPTILATVKAIRQDGALETAWAANPIDPEHAKAAAEHAAATIPGLEAEIEAFRADTEAATAAVAAADADAAGKEQLAKAVALVQKIENGVFENGRPKVLGIKDLEVRHAQRVAEAGRFDNDLAAKQLVGQLASERPRLTRAYERDDIDGAPPLVGKRGEFVYAPLWARYPHLQFARFPGKHSEASYNAYLEKLQAELEEKNKAVAEERARLDDRQAKLQRAKALVVEQTNAQAQREKALRVATKNSIGMANVGRYLLYAYPLSTKSQGVSIPWQHRVNRWAALVRVFHEPRVGFARGREGKGELQAMLIDKAPSKGWSMHEEIAKEPFDVVALPYESYADAIRVQGQKWCSDPAFARELIRLSIDVAELPAGMLKPLVRDDENVRRIWTLMDGRTDVGVAAEVLINRIRIVSFGIAIEVAARHVRTRLGRRCVADSPSQGDDPPRNFEDVLRHKSNLIGWDVPVLNTVKLNKMGEEVRAYISGVRDSLIGMMMRMGDESTMGEGAALTSAWARTTAVTIASGGSTRRLALVLEGNAGADDAGGFGTCGVKGRRQTDEAFEFGVTTKVPASAQALAEVLRFDEDSIFVHMHPTVLPLSGQGRDDSLLISFLASSHSVALCLYGSRYHVLFKDTRDAEAAVGGMVVIIDPEDVKTPLDFLKDAVYAAGKAFLKDPFDEAAEVPWTAMRLNSYRDAGQEGGGNFLIALARALALSLGVHRAIEGGQDLYPLLGQLDYETFPDRYDEGAEYKPSRDQASAVSDLKAGFGPLCIALAALCHNEGSVDDPGVETMRFELWD